MKRAKKMILILIAVLIAALLLAGCIPGQNTTETPAPESTAPESTAPGSAGSGKRDPGKEAFAVKTTLRELTSVDPEKGIGVYGRYTELTAAGEVPEALSRIIDEVNARAKETVEAKAKRFLAENEYPVLAAGSAVTERYSYRNISYIVNVTRADNVLISILETEMEKGIGDQKGEQTDGIQSCSFHASVYDTQSGSRLTLADFLQDQGTLRGRLEDALFNKYALTGLYAGGEEETPAWTADYLGLRFYFDGPMISEEKRKEQSGKLHRAVHVSIPYTELDGPLAKGAAPTPDSFIAQIEKNKEYALPHDKRVIRVEKAADDSGNEAYRIVIRDGKSENAWWLEYADDNSDYYVFRAQGKYYFYRLEDILDRAYVYNFESPDGGYGRFENQNAQCFDSCLYEQHLAVPYDPGCVHMRERARKYMDAVSGLNTVLVPNGHYAFLPERGRGRTWLHFALTDESLALDSRNVGCRLLHEVRAAALDEDGNANGERLLKKGEVLQFLRVDGESEVYYYMSPQYNMYNSGARDYLYDCALADGTQVRLVTRFENGFFIDGMYLNRIGEPVTLGAAQYEAGQGELPEHYVEIGDKKYKLIRDLSLETEDGEEIDFGEDIWWLVENYTGAFSGEEGDARLVISENGDVTFKFEGETFTGKLPEKRFYRRNVMINMNTEYESRTFQIIIEDDLPWHDPSFGRIRFYSEGLPATNVPSTMPPIEAELVRESD